MRATTTCACPRNTDADPHIGHNWARWPAPDGDDPMTRLELSDFPAWLVERGLRGLPLAEQVDAFCRRLVEAGFPATRFNMSIGTLHPRHGASSYVWRPDGIATELHARRRNDEQRAAYLRSPVYYLRSSGELRLRRRLDTGAPHEFPLLVDLQQAGMTDYAAQMVYFNDSAASTKDASNASRAWSSR